MVVGYFTVQGQAVVSSPGLQLRVPPARLQEAYARASPAVAVDESAPEQALRNQLELRARQRRVLLAGRKYRWRGVWVEGTPLLLGRPVRPNPSTQLPLCGMVLDWGVLRETLQRNTADLLTDVVLTPLPDAPADTDQRLASIPVQVTGERAFYDAQPVTSTRLMLLIAWCCVLLPAAGVAVLFVAALSLHERRGAFVSAVTHELRTPLTTFRMYTEMLAEGMVPEAKRPEYIASLHREAERLHHLVENVLFYARIERRRAVKNVEEVPLTAFLDHLEGGLRERAERAGMQLLLDTVPAEERKAMRRFVKEYLTAMVDPQERARVAQLAATPSQRRGSGEER